MTATLLEETDEMQVRDLMDQLVARWDAGDAEAYGELFSEDAVYVGYDGIRQEGRAGIVQMHGLLFAGVLRGSRLVGTRIEDIRAVGPDTAVLRATGTVVLRWQRGPAKRRFSRQTLVAQRTADGWQFVAFQNSRVRPMSRLARTIMMRAARSGGRG
jgi:uncharacterized protein (TIGR02246 family)